MIASGPAHPDSSAHPGGYFGPGLAPGEIGHLPGDQKPSSRSSRGHLWCPVVRSNRLGRRNVSPAASFRCRRRAGPPKQPELPPSLETRPGCAVLDRAGRSVPAHRWVNYRPLFWISSCGPTHMVGLKLLPAKRNQRSQLLFPPRRIKRLNGGMGHRPLQAEKRILPRRFWGNSSIA